ncbi:MAG: type II toxin-antitoxin system prevent-host-death family antitoxin [Cyanobacteria bacterium J06639_14]
MVALISYTASLQSFNFKERQYKLPFTSTGSQIMQSIDITEAKTQIELLFQSALSGEDVIITQNNQPILKLVPLSQSPKRRQRGSAKGQIWMSPDFDEPLADLQAYME